MFYNGICMHLIPFNRGQCTLLQFLYSLNPKFHSTLPDFFFFLIFITLLEVFTHNSHTTLPPTSADASNVTHFAALLCLCCCCCPVDIAAFTDISTCDEFSKSRNNKQSVFVVTCVVVYILTLVKCKSLSQK